MMRFCTVWSTTSVLWKNADWTWSECQLIAEIIAGNPPGVDASTLVQPWLEEPWNPYRAADREQQEKKRRRLIKLVCKVKGQEYSEEKELKDFKLTVDDIKMVVKAVSGIDLDVKMEDK